MSTPFAKYWLEFGAGLNTAAGPSSASAAGGGLIFSPATSYCPMRRVPRNVIASDVTRYVGSKLSPATFAAAQVGNPSAVTATSRLFIASQQTIEPGSCVLSTHWVAAVPTLPFCFKVKRTHLYFKALAVPVKGAKLAT